MNPGDHPAPMSSLPLFAEAARARTKDPESSHEAAGQASKQLRDSQEYVLAVFRENAEMTDEQLVDEYQRRTAYPMQSESGLRTRRHELVMLGKIVYSGRRDGSAPGKIKPRIWRLASGA